MCGPADFDALQTCITRVAELSAAGLGSYTLYGVTSLVHKLRQSSPTVLADPLRSMPLGSDASVLLVLESTCHPEALTPIQEAPGGSRPT